VNGLFAVLLISYTTLDRQLAHPIADHINVESFFIKTSALEIWSVETTRASAKSTSAWNY